MFIVIYRIYVCSANNLRIISLIQKNSNKWIKEKNLKNVLPLSISGRESSTIKIHLVSVIKRGL